MRIAADLLFTDLPGPADMRAWDAAAFASYGMPPAVMMENAAKAALDELQTRRPLQGNERILVVMGKGNNGGDGAAMARMLHDEGHRVLVCATTNLSALPHPAAEHVEAAKRFGVPFVCATGDTWPPLPEDFSRPHIVIDALTGTGLSGQLRPRELAFVQAINGFAQSSFILALDSPSGLCGESGHPLPDAVRATLTVAFEAPVRGLYIGRGSEFCGEIVTRRVGMPLALRAHSNCWRLLAPKAHSAFCPAATRHKGQAGRVLVIGGSQGMIGAPCLAALGALRAGCGLTHLAVPGALCLQAQSARPEFMVHPVGTGAQLTEHDIQELERLVKTLAPHALVLGPGLGRNKDGAAVVRALLSLQTRPPVICDADALFFLATPKTSKKQSAHALHTLLRPDDIITPHPGEAARLLPESFYTSVKQQAAMPDAAAKIALVQQLRPAALEALQQLLPSVIILKGPNTLIGQNKERVVLAPYVVAALGVGGSGDVLGGAVAALVAGGMPSFEAACLGAHLHGRAGTLLARKTPVGHLATDIANAIPLAWSELCPS